MKKQNLFWSLTAAIAMFFASCNNNIPGDEVSDRDATVKISIAYSSSFKASTGTIPGTTEENKITGIEAYTFDGNSLIDYSQANGTETTLKGHEGTVTIVVVANSNIGYENGTITLDQLMNKVSTHEFTKTNSRNIPTDGFVMSGIKTVTLTEGANNEVFTVKRTVSKFDAPTFDNLEMDLSNVSLEKIKELFPDFNGDEDRSKIEFEYSAYALGNGLDRSYLFNNANYSEYGAWTDKRNTSPLVNPLQFQYLNSVFDNKNYVTEGVYSGDFSASDPVYVHENFPFPDHVNGSVTGYNPKEVYCFIIQGKLIFDGNEQNTVTRYWRVNLVKRTAASPENDFYRIFRNGWYKVNINKILTIGYATPEEAEEEFPLIPVEGEVTVNISVEIADWDLYESSTEM